MSDQQQVDQAGGVREAAAGPAPSAAGQGRPSTEEVLAALAELEHANGTQFTDDEREELREQLEDLTPEERADFLGLLATPGDVDEADQAETAVDDVDRGEAGDPPVYDERGNVRPRGTEGARPMTYEERVEIAERLALGDAPA